MIAIEDEMEGASSSISRLVYDQISSPKKLIEIDGGHFGLLYYPGALFDKVNKEQCDFLKLHLMN